jgi:hypothetical protein
MYITRSGALQYISTIYVDIFQFNFLQFVFGLLSQYLKKIAGFFLRLTDTCHI